ncbi:MAG: hypothetical protein ACK5YK_01090 [Pseudomonadota bacterium]|jgi:hypothetical protein
MALTRTGKLVGLGTAAIGLIVVLALSINENRTIVVAAKPVTQQTNTSSTLVGTMLAPRYSGRSTDGTAWHLTANAAEQLIRGQTDPNSPTPQSATGELQLSGLTATLTRPTEPPLTISSQVATYTPNTSQLVLPAGVNISGTIGGYTVVMEAAQANAELSATRLRLTGGVSATLSPR